MSHGGDETRIDRQLAALHRGPSHSSTRSTAIRSFVDGFAWRVGRERNMCPNDPGDRCCERVLSRQFG
jgi:hypothetical protein